MELENAGVQIPKENGRSEYKIDKESYLNTVRKVLSTSNSVISRDLRVSRMTVHRFITKYPNVLDEAKIILGEIGDLSFRKQFKSFESFKKIPIIEKWIDTLIHSSEVTRETRRKYVKGFHNVCRYLKIHPMKIEPEDVESLIKETKAIYNERNKLREQGKPNDELPKNLKGGLSYLYIREGIKSFFSLMKNYSPTYLKGIGLTTLTESNRYARHMVNEKVRHNLENTLKEVCNDWVEYLEALSVDQVMFYSATRIGSILDFSFRKNWYSLEKDCWLLEVIDKGRKGRKEGGGKKWTKIFLGHALETLKGYCSKRFGIPIENLEKEVPQKVDKLFPTLKEQRIRKLNKIALLKAGLDYGEDFEPNHIFRHTFAQCCLRATNWNYDLVAYLGGWDSTIRLKRSYGAMDTKVRINGMKQALGLPVDPVEKEFDLRW